MSIWGVLGVLIAIAGGLVAVVKYMRGAEANRAALNGSNAELNDEQKRVRQMDAAAEEARKARRVRLREEVATGDTARLLRDTTGADDPNVN